MTALFGGERVAKTHPLIEAYGTVDETNSHIGVARAQCVGHTALRAAAEALEAIQRELFELGADLATPIDGKRDIERVSEAAVDRLEAVIDRFDEDLPPLKRFILPGGHPAAAQLHVARTVCRRAERLCVQTAGLQPLNEETIRYLNRLSDLLFVVARWINRQAGVEDSEWKPSGVTREN